MNRWLDAIKRHPGNVPLLGIVLLGAVAGGWRGTIIMLAIFGAAWIVGLRAGVGE